MSATLRSLSLGLLLALSSCATIQRVETSIELEASPEDVYAVLTDFEHYPDWNPYHTRIEGEPVVGAPLEVRLSRPDGKTVELSHVQILETEPGKSFAWGGGTSWIFRREHRFELEPLPNGATYLAHTEKFTGLFLVFRDLPLGTLSQGCEEMNVALKVWLEQGFRAPRR